MLILIFISHSYFKLSCRLVTTQLGTCMSQQASSFILDRRLVLLIVAQPAFTCSKLTIEALEQGVKYVQS